MGLNSFYVIAVVAKRAGESSMITYQMAMVGEAINVSPSSHAYIWVKMPMKNNGLFDVLFSPFF